MYEAIKRYETYVARNQRLDGKGTSTSAGQPKVPASPQGTSLDFTRQQHSLPPLVGQMTRLITLKVPRLMRTVTPRRLNLLTRKMRGCTSPVTSRRLYWMILVAHALRVQEMNSRRCFTCNRPGHLARDHQEWEEKNGIRPLQSKGPTLNKAASEKARQKPSQPGWPGLPTE